MKRALGISVVLLEIGVIGFAFAFAPKKSLARNSQGGLSPSLFEGDENGLRGGPDPEVWTNGE